METFYKRKPPSPSEESSTHRALDECRSIKLGPSLEKKFLEFDLEMLPSDPGLRPKMADYHPSDREEIRRYYLQKGPCQPKEMNFPLRKCGEQDIVNAMKLVKMSKQRLQAIRDDGWDSLLNEVSLFCEQHDVVILNMDDAYITYKKSKRNLPKVSNLHRFQVQVFYEVIDRQLQELNNRFTEVSTELLLCITCLSPRDSFSAFDKERLNRLAQFYPLEFSPVELLALDDELDTYFVDVCSDSDFLELKGIGDLSLKLVETGKHIVYPLVYLLLKLSLILPVATASAERAFSAMSIIKNRMRNRMGDEWLNNCLVTYIEGDILVGIENEKIIQRFQNMNNRRGKL